MPIRKRITHHGRAPVKITGRGKAIVQILRDMGEEEFIVVGKRSGFSYGRHRGGGLIFYAYMSPEYTLKCKGVVEPVPDKPHWYRLTDLGKRLLL